MTARTKGDRGRVRRATLADLAALRSLQRETFIDTYGADTKAEDMAQYLETEFSVAAVHACLTDMRSTVWVVTPAEPEHLLGYALLRADAPLPDSPGGAAMELRQLYIRTTAQGQGYGSQLLRTCLATAAQQGYPLLWLGVWEHNSAAQAFYRRWGFQKTGCHPFQLGNDVQTDWILLRPVDDHDPL